MPGNTLERERASQSPDTPAADHWHRLEKICASYLTEEGCARIEQAFAVAYERHAGQKRRSGEAYINHPVDVALILAEDLHMDVDTICAALLHDTVEDTAETLDDVRATFGNSVAELVDGVTKLTSIEVSSMDEKQALNLRKMFLAMSRDIRVIIIKLADRLHNMRTLAALPPDRQQFKSREAMDVYAPLADRLGIFSLKWELEDLSFFYLETDEYQRIARMVQDTHEQRNRETEQVISRLERELNHVGLQDFEITGRPKHLWSIYQKMKRSSKSFSDIYDLIALRVVTSSVTDCYSVLGAVHALWHPLPGRFKDYIATPKANGYQSLHTTVVGPAARPFEIQIRTQEMHERAENGIASHWLYKSSGNSKGEMSKDERAVDDQINWIRKSLDWATEGEIENPHDYLTSLRVDLYGDEIFVFTPKGEVMSLRKGSTPLDFAYAVHTEVGNSCVGAKVNGKVAPLTTSLVSGDRVEILTSKNSRPSRDWLNIVKTPSARSKIRKYFASVTKSDDAEAGRSSLARELRKAGYGISTQRSVKAMDAVREALKYRTDEDMLAAIATGKLSARSVANKMVDRIEADSPAHLAARALEARKAIERERQFEEDISFGHTHTYDNRRRDHRRRRKNTSGVIVTGDPDLLVRLARCCNPVAGDEILGFITRGRGVSVHRASCPNVKALMEHPERTIEVEWDTSGDTVFQVEIVVEAADRTGLLRDVTAAVGDAGANILSAATQTSTRGIARLRFMIEISDASLLDPLLRAVSKVPSVYDVRRIMPGEGARQMKRRM